MKKYFLGILAIVLAIGFSAFTKPAPKPVDYSYVFHYTGLTYIQSDVENTAKWKRGYGTCESSGEIACTIVVPESAVNFNGTALAYNVTIVANIPAGSRYGVDDVLQNLISIAPTIYNKS